jgi:hypothetical protein
VADTRLYALVAEFGAPAELLAAAKAMRAKGFDHLEAFSPFPVEGLARVLGFSERTVQVATLIGGMVGAVGGFAMQVATNLDFPLWIGGRPLVAVPAFMLITFELLVLGAVGACIGSMLVANRLPRFHHPIFGAEGFTVGDPRRFFLAVLTDEDFDRAKAGRALAGLEPKAIIEVPETP